MSLLAPVTAVFQVGMSIRWLVVIWYLAIIAFYGVIGFAAGRILAKMSDEQRARALPEPLLSLGRTSRKYWKTVALVHGLITALVLVIIAVIAVRAF